MWSYPHAIKKISSKKKENKRDAQERNEERKMERNENGYPIATSQGGGVDCRGTNGDNAVDASLGERPLAYAYVPVQGWRMLYSPAEALRRGTLFEELYMPMEVYGRE